MTVDHLFLEEVVQKDLGFNSVDDFIRQQALAIFRQKLDKTALAVRRYETKYGMNLSEFQQRVINQQDEALKHFGIFEKEDDLFDWEVEDHALPYYEQRVEQLSA